MKISPKSFRLHPEIDKMLDALALSEMTTRTAVLETAIKELAKNRKVSINTLPKKEENPNAK